MVEIDYALFVLDSYHKHIIGTKYNEQFSKENLQKLLPLVGECTEDEFAFLSFEFDAEHGQHWAQVVSRKRYNTSCPYIGQPEFMLILYLIEREPPISYDELMNVLGYDDLAMILNWWKEPVFDLNSNRRWGVKT